MSTFYLPDPVKPGPLSKADADKITRALRELYSLYGNIKVAPPLMMSQSYAGMMIGVDPSPGGVNTGESIQHNGSPVGTEPIINFIDGSNVTLTVTDSPANQRVNVTIASTGGGTGLKLQRNTTTPIVGPESTLNLIAGTGISYNVPTDNAGNSSVDITISAKQTETFTGYNWTFDSTSTTTYNGQVYLNGPTENCGYLFWCCKTYTLPSASNNNLDLSLVANGGGAVPVYVLKTSAVNSIITGIIPALLAGVTGPQIIALKNGDASHTITLNHNDSSSTAGNRFLLPPTYGASVVLSPNDCAILWWDACSDNKWAVLSCTVDTSMPNPYSTLTSNASLGSSFANIGLSVAIPGAGTYDLFAQLNATITSSSSGAGDYVVALLQDTTNAAQVGSAVAFDNIICSSTTFQDAAAIVAKYTAPSACTVNVQMKIVTSSGSTASALGGTGTTPACTLMAVKVE